mgnify:CR=1 FL=1
MKILHISNSLATGGAEKLLLETIPLLNDKGILTDLALLYGKDYPFLDILTNKKCCKIYKLSGGSVYNPFLVFKIIPLLRKYDLIHVHLFPALYWVMFAKIISFSRVKIVYTEHSTSNRRRDKFVFRILDKIIYFFYDRIITISSEVDFALKKYLNSKKEKFYLIPNGINLEFIANEKIIPKNELHPLQKDGFTFVIQVASFRYPKDQKTLIKSLKYLDDNVILLLVGEGELKNECMQLAKEMGLADRVFFLGIRMDVISLLKSSDVVVLSSHYEGLSLSCLEAMASGKPLVASQAPGLIGVVQNSGLLFPINDYIILANHIKKLLEDKEYYSSVAKKCYEKATEYDINKTINLQIALYKKLLDK